MKVVGLCGGSGSGKGTVAKILSEIGFRHIDTDAVYRTLTSYCSVCVRELMEAFGKDIFKDGRLDRQLLFKIVFGEDQSGEKRRTLNNITHRHIRERTEALIEKYRAEGASAVLVDAPLLFESEFDKLCSSVICVVAEEKIRINRIMARDGIDFNKALLRIRTQLPDDYLITRSDYSIENNGTEKELYEAVLSVGKNILDTKEEK